MTPADWRALTDSELDSALGAYMAAGDYLTPLNSGMISEIVNRIASPFGFFSGLVGIANFPNYEKFTAHSGVDYSQVESAQQSATENAASVASGIASGLGFGLAGVAVFAVVAIAVYAFASAKGRG